LATFTANKAKVMAHNIKVAAAASRAGNADADAPGHTLKLNQFSDWRREEFDRVMLPKKWKRDHGQQDPQQVSSAGRVPAVTAKDWQTAVSTTWCVLCLSYWAVRGYHHELVAISRWCLGQATE